MHRGAQMQFDAANRRRDFVDITKLVFLRALLVGVEFAVGVAWHGFYVLQEQASICRIANSVKPRSHCSARLQASMRRTADARLKVGATELHDSSKLGSGCERGK